MKKDSIKKVMKYKPPIYISLMVIIMAFLLFLYISSNHNSYAIEKSIEFSDTMELITTDTITSDALNVDNKQIPGLIVYKSSSNGYQNFSLNNKYNYSNNYTKTNKLEDIGLNYILSNSYPNKNFVDNNGKSIDDSFQTWITQVSIWLYLYEKEVSTNGNIDENSPYYLSDDVIYSIKNSKKLINKNKEFKADDTIYNTYIKKLVENALITNNKETVLDYFKEDKLYSTIDNKYYQTSEIKVITNESENFKGYKISVPEGVKVVNQEGNNIDSNTILDVTDTFYIRIPKNKKESNRKTELTITGIFSNIEGYIYRSEGYKDIVIFGNKDSEITSKFNIKI